MHRVCCNQMLLSQVLEQVVGSHYIYKLVHMVLFFRMCSALNSIMVFYFVCVCVCVCVCKARWLVYNMSVDIIMTDIQL